MDSGMLLALLLQATPPTPEAIDAAGKWFTMQFSIGDLSTVGSVVGAYALLRERLARLETKVEPMWNTWNMRDNNRRRP